MSGSDNDDDDNYVYYPDGSGSHHSSSHHSESHHSDSHHSDSHHSSSHHSSSHHSSSHHSDSHHSSHHSGFVEEVLDEMVEEQEHEEYVEERHDEYVEEYRYDKQVVEEVRYEEPRSYSSYEQVEDGYYSEGSQQGNVRTRKQKRFTQDENCCCCIPANCGIWFLFLFSLGQFSGSIKYMLEESDLKIMDHVKFVYQGQVQWEEHSQSSMTFLLSWIAIFMALGACIGFSSFLSKETLASRTGLKTAQCCNIFSIILGSLMIISASNSTAYSEIQGVNSLMQQQSTEYCGWKKYSDMKITGKDVIKGKMYKTGTLAKCQAQCLATKTCKSIVWGLPTNPKGFAGDCFLKTEGEDKQADIVLAFGFDTYTVPSKKACDAAKATAKKPTVIVPKPANAVQCTWTEYTNTDLPHQNLGPSVTLTSSTACKKRCSNTKGCQSIVWGNQNAPMGFAGGCQMKFVSETKTDITKVPNLSVFQKVCAKTTTLPLAPQVLPAPKQVQLDQEDIKDLDTETNQTDEYDDDSELYLAHHTIHHVRKRIVHYAKHPLHFHFGHQSHHHYHTTSHFHHAKTTVHKSSHDISGFISSKGLDAVVHYGLSLYIWLCLLGSLILNIYWLCFTTRMANNDKHLYFY